MKRKTLQLLSFCAALAFLLSACGSSTAGNNADSTAADPAVSADSETEGSAENTALSEDAQAAPAEGYDILGGQLWEVGGVLVRNKVIDIHDNKDLESLYRANYINFGSDGRFIYLDVFPKGGTYEPYETDDEYKCFLLKTDQTFKYDSDKNELVESESGTKKPYIIYILDDNTFEFIEFDSMTGKAKANEIPLFFVKSSADSPYIKDNKTELAQSSGNNAENSYNSAGKTSGSNNSSDNSSGSSGSSFGSGGNSSSSFGSGGNSSGNSIDSGGNSYDSGYGTGSGQTSTAGASSYQSILDTYTAKMERAVPGLVSEYYSESSGVSDIERLAEICNDKIGELAKICNDGVGEMAKLMNSRGDPYSTYESWAGKLMDNYSDIAQEISDAYLNSASY